MIDYSKGKNAQGEVVDCADCRHSGSWPRYPVDKFRVCHQPDVRLKLGGPRSCQDIVRFPGGLCDTEGKLFEKPKPQDDEE